MLQLDKAADEIIFLMSRGSYVDAVVHSIETLHQCNRQRRLYSHTHAFHRFAINAAAASRMAMDWRSFYLFVRLANNSGPSRITRQHMTSSHLEIMEILAWCNRRPRLVPVRTVSMFAKMKERFEKGLDRFFAWQDGLLLKARYLATVQMQTHEQLTVKPVT